MRYASSIFLGLIILFVLCCPSVFSREITDDNFGAIELYNQATDEAAAGHFLEAVNLTDKALSIQPNFTLALVTRSSAYLGLGENEKAEDSVQKALILDPGNPSALTAAASVYLQQGQERKAIGYAEKAVDSDPTMVAAWITKGTAHGNLGEYQEEINASQQALLLSPDNALAVTNREYAEKMLEQSHSTPFGLSSILLGLFCVLYLNRRF